MTQECRLAMELPVETQLDMIQLYLDNLPQTLPLPAKSKSTCRFFSFKLNKDLVDDIGEIGAINWELEVRLGQRQHGLKLREQGPGIQPLAHLLKDWTARFEDDVILKKWVFDILRAAQDAFEDSGLPVSSCTYDIQTKVLPYISQLPVLCDNLYTSDGDISVSEYFVMY